MKAGRMQAKDVPDEPVLAFLAVLPAHADGSERRWATWGPGYAHSVANAMPEGTPEKVQLAKMAALIRRGLVDGCTCGCRGDFELVRR